MGVYQSQVVDRHIFGLGVKKTLGLLAGVAAFVRNGFHNDITISALDVVTEMSADNRNLVRVILVVHGANSADVAQLAVCKISSIQFHKRTLTGLRTQNQNINVFLQMFSKK